MRFGSLYNSGYQTSDLMTLTPTGLGIGTTSPNASSKLHVADGDVLISKTSGYASLFFNFIGVGTSRAGAIKKNYDSPYDLRIQGGNNSPGSAPICFDREDGFENARFDNSGRFLVGTSTSVTGTNQPQYAKLQVVGNTLSGARSGLIALGRSAAASTIVAGDQLGGITFGDNAAGEFAYIFGEADGTAGTDDYPGRLVFSTTAAGDASPTEAMRINNEGIVLIKTTAAVGSTNRFQVSDGFGVSAPNGLAFNTTNAANVYVGSMSNGRSINATGTINASGADYAEYMVKCGDFSIAKGDVCGLTKEGLLTNVFADAIGFMVKSTNPSYVGNDTWVTPETIKDLAEPELEVERLRQQVDRIAFAGQVPVNVTGAAPGQYIVPIAAADGGITGIAKDEADLTFAEYMQAVGKVIAIENDGRARIIVKVA
jgi:hypothetical protein